MNALPAFDDPGWELLDGALPEAAAARTGGVGLTFSAAPIVFPDPGFFGGAQRTVAVLPGVERPTSVWVRRNGGSGIVFLSVEDPAGSDSWTDLTFAIDPPLGEWTQLLATFTPASGSIAWKVNAAAGGDWSADDAELDDGFPVEITLMPAGLREAYVALFHRIQSIRKADGYWHDVDPALVVPRMAEPGQTGAPQKFPYICLPVEHVLGPDMADYPEVDSGSVRIRLRQPVIVFLGKNDSPSLEDGGAVDALRWHDDILRAVMGTSQSNAWDLGAPLHVKDVNPHKFRAIADPPPGGHAHVAVELLIDVIVTRDTLGPGA